MNIGKTLTIMRLLEGKNRKEFEEASGIPERTIQHLETNTNKASIRFLIKIMEYYKITFSEFFNIAETDDFSLLKNKKE